MQAAANARPLRVGPSYGERHADTKFFLRPHRPRGCVPIVTIGQLGAERGMPGDRRRLGRQGMGGVLQGLRERHPDPVRAGNATDVAGFLAA